MADIKQNISIPENLAEYIIQHDGVNLAINFNSASADHGYAHVIHHSVVVSKLTRTCNRCGYDQLWSPDDSNSKCVRHTYSNWRYDAVFVWTDHRNAKTLEDCFTEWLAMNQSEYAPCKYMEYGVLGWSL